MTAKREIILEKINYLEAKIKEGLSSGDDVTLLQNFLIQAREEFAATNTVLSENRNILKD